MAALFVLGLENLHRCPISAGTEMPHRLPQEYATYLLYRVGVLKWDFVDNVRVHGDTVVTDHRVGVVSAYLLPIYHVFLEATKNILLVVGNRFERYVVVIGFLRRPAAALRLMQCGIKIFVVNLRTAQPHSAMGSSVESSR